MTFLGLHILDWLILCIYFVSLIYIGRWASKKIKNTQDFYQGGRSFGKILFAFLNFGNITSADQATGVSREIYRQGLSGLWFHCHTKGGSVSQSNSSDATISGMVSFCTGISNCTGT